MALSNTLIQTRHGFFGNVLIICDDLAAPGSGFLQRFAVETCPAAQNGFLIDISWVPCPICSLRNGTGISARERQETLR
jgi:hypothetical protein